MRMIDVFTLITNSTVIVAHHHILPSVAFYSQDSSHLIVLEDTYSNKDLRILMAVRSIDFVHFHYALANSTVDTILQYAVQLLSVASNESSMSDFHCTHDTLIHSSQHFFTSGPMSGQGMCEFQNVCLVEGKLTYFIPDDKWSLSQLPSLQESYDVTNPKNFKKGPIPSQLPITFKTGPIPSEYAFGAADLYVLEHNTVFSFNFGHLFFDSLFPILLAMEVLGLDWNDKRVVLILMSQDGRYFLENGPHGPHRNKQYYELLLKTVPIKSYDGTICARRLLTGQESFLSLPRIFVDRGAQMRRIRSHVWLRLNLHPKIPERRHYLAAVKASGFGNPPLWPNLCEDVGLELNRLHLNDSTAKQDRLTCIEPHKLSFQEIVDYAINHSVFISEDGTVSYNVLFAQDHTCAIIIGSLQRSPPFKEWHVLLYLTHVHVFFVSVEKKSEFRILLQLCAMNHRESLQRTIRPV